MNTFFIKTTMILKERIKKVYCYVKKKYVVYSFISSLILIFISYFANNSPLFTGESMIQYSLIQNICEKIGIHKTVNYGDAIFYNVSYDKMLIPSISDDDRQDTLGVNVITDRQKLLRFLKLLNKTDKYKYVIIDLTFDKKDVSVYDDSLFHQISEMRDIVVANHSEINFADSNIVELGKTGLVTFFTTSVTTNFGRFEFMLNKDNSLPLVIYEKMNPGKRMKRYGCGRLSFYTLGGRLCQNACFLTFDNSFVGPITEKLDDNHYTLSDKYINLGKFIDNPIYDETLLSNLIERNTNNKYVVIGDFIGDIHDTYIGPIPGSVIMMRALATLEEGGNMVYVLHIFLWFVVFFFISLSLFYDKPISKRVPMIRNIKRKWFHFLFSVISFGFVLILNSILEYICDYPVYSLMIPILYFSVLKIIIKYKKYA